MKAAETASAVRTIMIMLIESTKIAMMVSAITIVKTAAVTLITLAINAQIKRPLTAIERKNVKGPENIQIMTATTAAAAVAELEIAAVAAAVEAMYLTCIVK